MASPNLTAEVETKIKCERHLLVISNIQDSHIERTQVKCEFKSLAVLLELLINTSIIERNTYKTTFS